MLVPLDIKQTMKAAVFYATVQACLGRNTANEGTQQRGECGVHLTCLEIFHLPVSTPSHIFMRFDGSKDTDSESPTQTWHWAQ